MRVPGLLSPGTFICPIERGKNQQCQKCQFLLLLSLQLFLN